VWGLYNDELFLHCWNVLHVVVYLLTRTGEGRVASIMKSFFFISGVVYVVYLLASMCS
jgi:hypothetical protein